MNEQHLSPQKYWESQQSIFQKIYSAGMESYIQTIPDIQTAFALEDRVLRCIDERTPGGIHIAGSGILLKGRELKQTLKAARPTSVWTHAECGAAKLYAEQNGLDPTKADLYARAWGKNLETNFGITYNGHLDVKPNGHHIARVAYYDATGTFNYQNTTGLPPGFVISRKYLSSAYALAEMQVAINIATGDHGFGQLITKETPFVIVPIADRHTSLETLIKELEPLANNNPLILINGFTAPHINLTEIPINVSKYQ